MAIVSTELKAFSAKTIDDTSNNGGRMSKNQIVSNVVQNVWPNAFQAERLAGSEKWRKLFFANRNDDDLILYYPQIRVFDITAGDDWIIFGAGTQRDTQGTKSISRYYGVGRLNTNVSSGTATIIVDLENNELKSGTYAVFVAGDTISITDKATFDSGTGNYEELVIDTVTPHATLAQVTIVTTTNLVNSYLVSSITKISSIYKPSDIIASYDNYVKTSASGTYDISTYPIDTDNIGTREITVTFTCTTGGSAPIFSVVDDESQSWGSWDTSGTDFSPTNPDFSKPLFTIYKAGIGGTWAINDTIVFQTHPAAAPLWERRKIPASCGSLANNKTISVFGGQSA